MDMLLKAILHPFGARSGTSTFSRFTTVEIEHTSKPSAAMNRIID